MSDFGVTDQGFVSKNLTIIKQEIEEALRTVFGNTINTTPQSLIGQFVNIMADREVQLWEVAESTYNSQYPESAEDINLENVGSITALTKLPALPSLIEGQALFGTTTTIIPVGTILSVDGSPTSRFLTLSEVILIAGTDEIQDISFISTPISGSFKFKYLTETTSAIPYDATNTDVEDALNALNGLSGIIVVGSFAAGFTITFAGSDGKQPQPLLITTDNTLDVFGIQIYVVETTPGVYQGQTNCQAEDTGAIIANTKTLTVIETPIAGFDSAFNPEDAILGRDKETNEEFRIRRVTRLQISLAGPIEAIRSALLKLNEIEGEIPLESVIVTENNTNETDAQGLPPKSVRAVVYQSGGATDRDQEIGDVLWLSKSGGIETVGDVPITVTDSQGIQHTLKFERPDEVDIYLELDLDVDSDYPTDGDTQVQNLIALWGDALGVGIDVVVYPSLVAQLDNIPGITDVVVRIGIAASPVNDDNIIIDDGSGGAVEISRWDTSRIIVVST